MLFSPTLAGKTALDAAALAADKDACQKIGPCGVGRKALYLSSRFFDRCRYVVYGDVERVFKRVAMSRGGFTGKGMFGSMAYLVVRLADGSERQCYFKHEEKVDELLAAVARAHPNIPTHSEAAERKLREAEEAERARYLKELSPEAEAAVAELRAAQERLAARRDLTDALAFAAKQKRIIDGISPTYRYAAIAILLMAIAAAVLGAILYLQQKRSAGLLVPIGFAAIFFVVSARVLPTGHNNSRFAQQEWDRALANMRDFLDGEEAFPVPAQYAHPVVLERMIRVLREGRAMSVPESYALMKDDLRALNSGVTVSQKEYDEVVRVKPLFLVCNYAD